VGSIGVSDPRDSVSSAQILQIIGGSRTADKDGNIYAGYALVEFDLEGETRRDIIPFGTDGGLRGCGERIYYLSHGLGDWRPDYAEDVL
jgi:hypothetical protein